jgi:methylenetetrahydrofolate reductase (NADPH)
MIRSISFEFFPPKTPKLEAKLWQSIERLAPIGPKFVSVTYGAGGSTRTATHKIVKTIISDTDLNAAAHLTCVSASKEEVDSVIDDYKAVGVNHIVALRGDMPDMGLFQPHPNGYSSSVDLVEAIKKHGCFDISVSAYPEKHPESSSFESDINLLKAKIDAGADQAITQFAYDTDVHASFRDKITACGINVPLIPGIMPTTNFKGVQRMAEKCGTSIPDWLTSQYIGLEEDLERRQEIAINVVVDQCRGLISEGFDRLHFYTLNQYKVIGEACHILGLGVGSRLAEEELTGSSNRETS